MLLDLAVQHHSFLVMVAAHCTQQSEGALHGEISAE